jgi:hypothetical protein
MRTSLILSFAFLSACTIDRSAGQPIQQVIGSSGGSITITAAEDATLAGTQLVIPPGAVPDGTVVAISKGAPQNGAGEQAISPSVRLLPDGLKLAKPATLFFPYPGQPARTHLFVEVTSLGQKSQREGLLVSSAAGLAQLQIDHFSDWQIVAVDCPPQPDIGSVPDLSRLPDLSSGSTDFGTGLPDLGTPINDLSPGGPSDGGPPANDLAPGGSHDLGDVADLAPGPAGYGAPLGCGEAAPNDLATLPPDLSQPF